MARKMPELSIVMPCLNEAETVGICIKKAKSFLKKFKISGEIIVGDNGSEDGSTDISKRMGAKVINIPVKGYGSALDGAIKKAKGKYIIMADSDNSYDFENIMPILIKLRKGYDLVVGNRFKGKIKKGAMPWKNKYIGNPLLSGLGKIFFQTSVGDFHCGLRGISKTAFKKLNLVTLGMEYASEMIIKAKLIELKVDEVPITLSPAGRTRNSHLSPFKDGWRHLRFMLLYSPKWLFFYPGLLIMLISTIFFLWILSGIKQIGFIFIDVHSLTFSAFFILVGYQMIVFFLFSNIYAFEKGLLPLKDYFLSDFISRFKLEIGLIIGSFILILGLTILFITFIKWQQLGFGNLEPRYMLRMVTPSGLLIALGIQIIFTSFLIGITKFQTQKK